MLRVAVHAPMARSSSSTRRTRPSLCARSGSVAKSDRPIASINRLKMLSPFPATRTY